MRRDATRTLPTPRQLRAINTRLDAEAAAVERVGETPEDRLRWVLGFLQKDLKRLRPEERVALGDDLRAEAVPPVGWGTVRPLGPMPDAQLRRLQVELSCGIRALFSGPTHPVQALATGGWALPPGRARLVRMLPGQGRRQFFMVRWRGLQQSEAAIVWGVADLVTRVGDRFRACLECGAPFVATKRQEYCSLGCSQKMRNRRKQERKARGA